jgi:rubrerythrin
MTRPFESLSPKEVLALAIHVERANAERFRSFAYVFRQYDEGVADRFEELAKEEEQHEAMLVERFRVRFGKEIPQVREVDVKGVIESVDMDESEHLIFDSLQPRRVYELAHAAEVGALSFYRDAAKLSGDPELAALYRELAEEEEGHASWLEKKLAGSRGRGSQRPSQ